MAHVAGRCVCGPLPLVACQVQRNPVIRSDRLSQNPALINSTALEVYEAVLGALGKAGLMVILDNHMSTGGCGGVPALRAHTRTRACVSVR